MSDKKTFEEKTERLNEILVKLESDKSLSLDETTSLYKEGKELCNSLNEELNSLKSLVSNDIE